jgi:hypothetical protein
MFYPINKDCDTDPLVPIDNITLTNVTSHGSILPAGIIRCNSTRPCTGINFNNVQLKSPIWDLLGYGFITEYAEGTAVNSHPDPGLKTPGFYSNLENRLVDESLMASEKFSAENMMQRAVNIMTKFNDFQAMLEE